ncbi:MAG TPA: ATP-binding protein [Thermoanaerobaculia bacterium]|nr:ATP-binding protein [Thermoanaerobaculia bacterium]
MARGPDTVQRKLIIAILGTSITVLAIFCSVFITYEYVSFRKDIVRGLATRGGIIAANSTAALAFQNEADAREVLSAFRMDPHIVAACLYDRDGRVFAKYPADAPTESFPPPPRLDGGRFEGEHVVVSLPVAQGNRQLGTVYLKSDLSAMSERFRIYAALVAFAVASSLGVAFTFSNRLQKRVSAPILDLAGTARQVSEQKDYALRARKVSDDEIGQLTDSFNGMLAQIQERDTALRKTEEEVRKLNVDLEQRVAERTMQLQAANKELESFAYSVSHDLRAPLRAIDGFSQVLLEDHGEGLGDTGRAALVRIRKGASRMAHLIDDMLKLSRVTRADLQRTRVDLSKTAGGVVAELARVEPDRQVEIRIADGVVVEGDQALLQLVLENLLGNAFKFTSKTKNARVEFGVERQDGVLSYFVRDNGAGFDKAYAHNLFGAFQRLHSEAQFPGTGIGLATVQRIIHRHGGRVWAEGTVDGGATFRFTL